jgi:hypothetical protein
MNCLQLSVSGALLAFALFTNPGVAQTARDQLVGTWMLVSNKDVAPDGSKKDNFGPDPIGTASFDGNGRFSIIIMRSDLPKVSSNNRLSATADENKAVIQGSITYFGTYTVSQEEPALIFKIESATFPNWKGTTQKRMITGLTDDVLTLINAAPSGGGTAEIQWRRAK